MTPPMHAHNPYAPPAAPSQPLDLDLDLDPAPLASRGARLVATLLDGMLTLLVMVCGTVVIGMVGNEAAADVLVELSILALWIYQWMLVSRTGQTLGKRWCGIRIVRRDGMPVSFVSGVLMRNWLMKALTCFPLLGGPLALVDALMIFGSDRRCLHDRIAGTKVVVAR